MFHFFYLHGRWLPVSFLDMYAGKFDDTTFPVGTRVAVKMVDIVSQNFDLSNHESYFYKLYTTYNAYVSCHKEGSMQR